MELNGILILTSLLIAIVLIAIKNYPADVVFLTVLTLLFVTGVVSPAEALIGFSNEGMLTVGALYIVAAGMRETGGVQFFLQKLMGKPSEVWKMQSKLMLSAIGLSAFLNNTPIVSTLIPGLQEWCKKHRISVKKLLIPLSYAAILGGTCTLIGTSTNLIVNGMLISEKGVNLNMFDPALVGLPIAVAGFFYLLIFGRKLLPDDKNLNTSFENTREYTIEMIVQEESALSGKTVEAAGLRQLPGLFLIEVDREGALLPAVEPDQVLQGGDRLIFTGLVDSIADLQRIDGLEPATEQVFKLDTPRRDRHLVEAVVSQSNPILGKSIKEGDFRKRFGAVVVAVSRGGERIDMKVGDIVLKIGDILLMEAPRNFADRYKHSSDFLLVSTLSRNRSFNYEKSGIAWGILIAMVALVSFNVLSMFQGSFMAAIALLATRCLHINEARESVDWQVLIVIAAALGIGNAMQISGIANTIAGNLLVIANSHPYLSLAMIYFVTWALTEIITNNAAAVLIFPFAISISATLGTDFMPFVMTIMFAASASFATPIGYQTNLMVYGAGGYKFSDFLRIGLPLNLIVAVITILLVPKIWPF